MSHAPCLYCGSSQCTCFDTDEEYEMEIQNQPLPPLTLDEAQSNQPWTVPYSDEVTKALDDVPHLLATHAVLHAAKTVGKLAAVFEELDHSGLPMNAQQRATVMAMSADLVTIALRMANLYQFSLANMLETRVKEKNGVGFR